MATARRAFSSSYPEHTLFPMPALSPTMESGSIAEWKLKAGDEFAAGDVLCSIETDKAQLDFDAQDDGILAKILVQPGVDIAIGTPICVVVDDASDVAAFADYKVVETATVTTTATTESSLSSAPPAAAAPSATSDAPSLLLPSARHMAESKGKDATVLKGSGKGGRVTKGDVLTALQVGNLPDLQKASAAAKVAAASAPPSTTPPTTTPVQPSATATPVGGGDLPLPPEVITGQSNNNNNYEDVANNKMRKIIAKRLTESKSQVPHSYASMEVSLDNVLALRKQLVQNYDVKVSVNDFIIRCSALALRDVPEVNGTYDSATGTVKQNPTIDVSVAVATPTGLITPIVFNTDQLGLSQIAATVRDLAGRARQGALAPHEYQGGSFSVSNLGMFGITEFSAVINPPQAAILAVGAGSPKLVPSSKKYDETKETTTTQQHPPKIQTTMTARLSADRRVVDEATAGLFLQAFCHYIQKPELLIL